MTDADAMFLGTALGAVVGFISLVLIDIWVNR